jgi:hypothetical protein
MIAAPDLAVTRRRRREARTLPFSGRVKGFTTSMIALLGNSKENQR